MSADESLAAILQLASPALPIGAFSYSSGLEMAIELGWVKDAASAQKWIAAQLNETVLRWEIPLWGRLYSAWAGCAPSPSVCQTRLSQGARDSSLLAGSINENEVALPPLPTGEGWGEGETPANNQTQISNLNTQAIAARETAELRSEQTQMGHALRRWCVDVLPEIPAAQKSILISLEPLSVLTAHALAAYTMGISAHAGATAYAFGFVENQVMAASKAIPLGQTATQQSLRAITANIAPQVVAALALPEAHWSSAAPLAAIASMKHETQYTRLFRS
jgi:urease accessory protein